jgi:hypothetical protein
VVLVLIAIVAAVLLRKAAPPEAVRLLPGAQGYLYLNLKPLRRAGLLDKMPPVQLDPEYDEFVRQTGFQFERDLEEAAIAVHAPAPTQPGGNPGQVSENRFSEVIVAHFDGDRAHEFLRKNAKSTDSYNQREIFNIPRENRTLRVCILAPDIVVVSNVDDPLVIRGVIDRYRKLASPFGGPRLVRRYYRTLPFGTLAWAIADIAHGSQQNKALLLPGGFDLFFPPDTVLVGSVRYLGSIDLKVQAVAPNEDAARTITDQLSAFLGLFRTLELNAGGPDPDVKAFFESIKVEQDGTKAQLTADLPKGFLKKLLTEPPPEVQPPASLVQPEAEKPAPKKRHKRAR